jgi:hypothetical protein
MTQYQKPSKLIPKEPGYKELREKQKKVWPYLKNYKPLYQAYETSLPFHG